MVSRPTRPTGALSRSVYGLLDFSRSGRGLVDQVDRVLETS